MLLEVCLLVSLLALTWQFLRNWYGQFERSCAPYKKCIPLIGNFWRSLLKRESLVYDFQRYYNNVGDERTRFVGAYSLLFPGLLLKDPQVIKQVTVKDFDCFSDHQNGISEDVEPVIGKSLIVLRGQKWRDMRAALSPIFTSSRMRDMCPFMSDVGKLMTEYVETLCDENFQKNGEASIEMEMKNLSTRFTNDVIASTIFGIEINSFKNENNEFLVMGKLITKFSTMTMLKMMIVMLFPWIGKVFTVRLFDERMNSFFRGLVLDAMKYRKENNIIRRDMIQLLMDAKQGNLKHEKQKGVDSDAGFATVEESDIGTRDLKRVWEDDELVAQALLFFFAGFETASTLTSFLMNELAVNPEVQDKLREEVDEYVESHGVNVTYDVIQNMKYVDMVVSECLRKWPPNVLADRLCVKSIDIGPARDGERTSYTVHKGDIVWIAAYCIHRDEKYWPDPEKFDPERFSDENKHKIIPFTYIPFGTGPRNCIGSRFALMEAKVYLYHIIANFRIEACSRTSNPIVLDKSSVFVHSENGFWVKFVKRNIPRQ